MKKQYNTLSVEIFTTVTFDLCFSGEVYATYGNDNCGKDIW